MLKIALYQPEIPHNTGALIRLCACFEVQLHIIHPCGFVWSDKHLARSGLDYHELATVVHHGDMGIFQEHFPPQQVLLFAPDRASCYTQVVYQPDHVLLFGQESVGFSPEVETHYYQHVSIPMAKGCRSLNLALSAAIASSEALRQLRG
jgi:tRNA (cytidine/uridine-2'-O-)-methyltransferase